MSLRVRLVLLIVALVALVALALSALHLDRLVNSLSADALERSELASQQVEAFVTDQINQRSDGIRAARRSRGDQGAVERDRRQRSGTFRRMLDKDLALSPAMVEINVAGQTGKILASSNPSRIGTHRCSSMEMFGTWRSRPLYRRLLDLLTRRPDYQVTVPLGLRRPGESDFHYSGGDFERASAQRAAARSDDAWRRSRAARCWFRCC